MGLGFPSEFIYELGDRPVENCVAGPRNPALQTRVAQSDVRVASGRPYFSTSGFKSASRRRSNALIKLPRISPLRNRCPTAGVGLRAFKPIWRSYNTEGRAVRLCPSPCRIGDLQPRGVLLPEVRCQRPRPADGDFPRWHSARAGPKPGGHPAHRFCAVRSPQPENLAHNPSNRIPHRGFVSATMSRTASTSPTSTTRTS